MGYKRKTHYILSEGDVAIFEHAVHDARFFSEFYLTPAESEQPWSLYDWQMKVHHASQREITIIGGYGCGKTIGVAASAIIHSTMTPGFKFMNVAQVSWQANQMFHNLLLDFEDTEWWDRFVFSVVEKPYPVIDIQYIIPPHISGKSRDIVARSSMEFMSVSDDGTHLLSWGGDWINIDEAGLIEDLGGLQVALGSRLRGKRRTGEARMGRLSMMSNSWDNLDMWFRYDQAIEDPKHFLSLKVSTFENEAITPEQVEDFKRRFPPDEIDRWLHGERPAPRGKEFSALTIEVNTADWLDELMTSMLEQNLPEVEFVSIPKAGAVDWRLPPDFSRDYLVIGDPGQGNAPDRNSPCIMVWDVTDFVGDYGVDFTDPTGTLQSLAGRKRGKATLRAFWWGRGNGDYEPFIRQFLMLKHAYTSPSRMNVDAMFDSTGTQKGFDTIFSLLEEDMIFGVDLAGYRKSQGLTALKLLMEKAYFAWPRKIKGITYQLGAYEVPDTKIAQDVVSVLIMTALWLRRFYYYDPMEREDDPEARISYERPARQSRNVLVERNRTR